MAMVCGGHYLGACDYSRWYGDDSEDRKERATGKLKPYVVFSREGCSEEENYLVFAHSCQEARKVSWRESEVREMTDFKWTNVRARLLRGKDYLFSNADPAKLAADEAHGIECPTFCKDCGIWSKPINPEGYCPDCRLKGDADD